MCGLAKIGKKKKRKGKKDKKKSNDFLFAITDQIISKRAFSLIVNTCGSGMGLLDQIFSNFMKIDNKNLLD